MLQVYLLAFDTPKEGFPGITLRAMIPYKNRPVVTYLLDTLRGMGHSTPQILTSRASHFQPILEGYPGVRVVENPRLSADFMEAALKQSAPTDTILVMNASMPFLTPEDIVRLAQEAEKEPGLILPIVSKGVLPLYLKKKTAPFAEGTFTPGYALAFPGSMVHSNAGPLLQTVERYAAAPLQIMQELGPAFLLKLMFGQLSLNDVRQNLSDRLKIPVHFLQFHTPGFANSVSRPTDFG